MVFFAYVAEEVDEGVVAGVGQAQPVAAEPDHVDVRIADADKISLYTQEQKYETDF